VWGPPSPVQPLADRIATYLSPPLFPVRLTDIPADLTFHDAPEDPVAIGSATIRAAKVTHQGPTVGYRIEEQGRSLAYVPDHEPGLGASLTEIPFEWISGSDLVHGVDVLFHDAQYFDHEYPNHVGWGHSSVSDVVELARRAEVDRLVLFHHDPYHTDDDLEALLAAVHAAHPTDPEWASLAFEGMTVVLTGDRGAAVLHDTRA
jgi:ribonuclease BN (tRNA processing enzyme)